jgi:hypothetical protein
MNLDKYSTKESLEALVQNKDEFFTVINESTGFILEMLKNNNVKPELDMLVDNLSVFTIQYITDNYQLNPKQTEKITIFLSDEETVYNKKLKPEEVEEYLINKKPLPRSTDLSLEQINRYTKEIEEQFKMDESSMESILNYSFRKFSIDDVYKIDRKFLLNNAFILTNKPVFFNDVKFKEFYKEIIFKAYKKPSIRHFRSYVFTLDEKDFLIKLLENEEMSYWRDEYTDYSKIPGFKSLISKYEFFEKFNKGNIEHFSDAEVENNVDFFKKVYLEDKEDRSYYETFNRFFNRKMTLKKFKAIFDEDFVAKYISEITSEPDGRIRKFFGYNDAEYDKSVIDKKAHLSRIVAGLVAENKTLENGKKITDVTKLYDVFSFRDDLERQRNSPLDEQATLADKQKLEEHYHTIFNNILPQYLNNKKLYRIANHTKDIFDPLTISMAEEFFKNNVNVNNFSILASIYEQNNEKHFHDYNKHQFMEKLVKYITTMHTTLVEKDNHDDLVAVGAILNSLKKNEKGEDDKFIKELIKKTPKRKGIINPNEYNFLAFETNGIDNSIMWEKVHSMRPELADYVLKNNIIPPNYFIKHCLNNIGLKKNVGFLKTFAQKNREYIEDNDELLAAYLASSKQEEIFPQNNTDKLEKYFNETLTLIKRSKVADINQDVVRKLYPKEEMPYSFDDGRYPEIDLELFDENIEISKDLSKHEAKTLYLYLYKKEQLLNKKVEAKGNLISYSFMVEKLEEHVKKKDFSIILSIQKSRVKYNHEPFINYVNNASFDDLKNDLNDEYFFSLLKDSIESNNKTKIQFSKFSYEQNMELAKILLDRYKEKKESEGFRYSYTFLHFFAEENRDFVKEFAIENFPTAMFYGYDFRPQGSDSFNDKKLVKGTYSNEEIYQAFLNLEEKGDGFLSYRDVNADYKNLFSPVFFPESRKNKTEVNDKKYKSFLNFVKDKSPMLYLLVANQEIFSPMLDFGRRTADEALPKYRTRDESAHHYFLETFDIDTILKGAEVIIDKMANPKLDEDGQDIINKKLASYAISRMLMHTYYDYYDSNYKEIYESTTSHEDTIKLMKLLFTKSPLHLIERHKIGQAMDTVGFFKANIEEFYSFENIKKFIFPSSEIHCEYFELEDRHGNTSSHRLRLLGFTQAIIETAVEKRDTQVIDFMNHAISQHKFIKKEMKHNHRHSAYQGIYDGLINAISKDANITNLLTNAKLKMDLDGSLVVNAPVKRKNKL